MIKNISILTFIRINFLLALILIFLTFSMFIAYDKTEYKKSLQNKYELLAENFLHVLKNHPTQNSLNKLFKKFKVILIEDRDEKLRVIINAKEISFARNPFGTYRIFIYNDSYYIYVQRYGYNIMLKNIDFKNYNINTALLGIFAAILILLFLYKILRKKLCPLEDINKEIIKFSKGNKNITLSYDGNDEIGVIAKNFNKAIKIIENQSKSKDLFMRNMMHELKTPITKAMFIVETLENESSKEYLQKAFKRMDDIIKELATVEKLTSSNNTLYKEKCYFFDIYTNTLDLMLIKADKIETKIQDFNCRVDKYLFSIALKNLIDNAIKFSTNNKAILIANKNNILVGSRGKALEHKLSYYTEAFSQEEKRSSGFGLGLYIVNTIINLHNFKFEYEHKNEKNFFIINFSKN